MLSRRIRPSFDSTFGGHATRPLQKKLFALATTKFANSTCMSSQFKSPSLFKVKREVYRLGDLSSLSDTPYRYTNNELYPTFLRRSASIMWNGRDIADRSQGQSSTGNCPYRRFATRTRTFDNHICFLHSTVHGSSGHTASSQPGSIWRAFSRAFEATASAAGPGNRIAIQICRRNDRIIEGGVDMHHTIRHHFLRFTRSLFPSLSHSQTPTISLRLDVVHGLLRSSSVPFEFGRLSLFFVHVLVNPDGAVDPGNSQFQSDV